MFGEPILEQRVRNADGNRTTAVGDKCRRLEPRGEAVAVNFCFDAGEDLVPDARVHAISPEKPRKRDFRLLKRTAAPNATSAGTAPRPENRPLRASPLLKML